MVRRKHQQDAGEEQAETEEQAEEQGSEGLPATDQPEGVFSYDPDKRPGQAPARDDPTDTQYRRTQGMSGAGHAVTAEGMAGRRHEQAPLHPATMESGKIPGAGDPQNGVLITDWRVSSISWVQPTWDVAQHYPEAEAAKAAAAKTVTPAPA